MKLSHGQPVDISLLGEILDIPCHEVVKAFSLDLDVDPEGLTVLEFLADSLTRLQTASLLAKRLLQETEDGQEFTKKLVGRKRLQIQYFYEESFIFLRPGKDPKIVRSQKAPSIETLREMAKEKGVVWSKLDDAFGRDKGLIQAYLSNPRKKIEKVEKKREREREREKSRETFMVDEYREETVPLPRIRKEAPIKVEVVEKPREEPMFRKGSPVQAQPISEWSPEEAQEAVPEKTGRFEETVVVNGQTITYFEEREGDGDDDGDVDDVFMDDGLADMLDDDEEDGEPKMEKVEYTWREWVELHPEILDGPPKEPEWSPIERERINKPLPDWDKIRRAVDEDEETWDGDYIDPYEAGYNLETLGQEEEEPDLDVNGSAPDNLGALPLTGTLCSVCRNPQYRTPSGETCAFGHGGAPGIDPAEVEKTRSLSKGLLNLSFLDDSTEE